MEKLKKYLPAILILALLLFAVLFRSNGYIMLLLCTIGIYVIAVSGLDLLFGYTGQISLGHAAFYAIGAYTSAILTVKLGWPVWAGIVSGTLLSAVVGIIVAFPASKLVHHFLALLTIAFGQMMYIFIANTPKLTNGFTGINRIPPITFGPIALDNNFYFFFFILFVVVIFLIAKQRIIDSRIGRAFVAIRENSHAATGIGINVQYYKIMAFMISALYTGLAGAFYVHFISFVSPDTFQLAQSIIFLTMLLFGGMGTLYGPIIGATVLCMLEEYLQVVGSYSMLIYGAVILVVLLFLPRGVIGLKDLLPGFKVKSVNEHA